jgi:TPR repeat protein
MFSKLKRFNLIFVLILALVAGTAHASKDVSFTLTKQEFENLKIKADQGNVAAEFSLALTYYKPLHWSSLPSPEIKDTGVLEDNKKALEYLEKVAATNNVYYGPKAQTYIGFFYDRGIVVDRDYKTALKWYQMAASRNYPRAEDLIGRIYRDGHGVPQNYAIAAQFFEKAANQGTISNIHLARLYSQGGPGLPQDYEKAFFWLSLPRSFSRENGADDICCEDEDLSNSYYNPYFPSSGEFSCKTVVNISI